MTPELEKLVEKVEVSADLLTELEKLHHWLSGRLKEQRQDLRAQIEHGEQPTEDSERAYVQTLVWDNAVCDAMTLLRQTCVVEDRKEAA